MKTCLFTEAFRPLNEAEAKHAPRELYVSGDLSLLNRSVRVSIIGSRESSQKGLLRARRLSRFLASKQVTIVSGLAKGIDTAAHHGAIDVGGRTLAVIGTPLSIAYPRENEDLQALIAKAHLLISQFPEGRPVGTGNFPIRNRLMALITDATVIMEAKDGSGTIHQGWEALRLARPLWIPKSVFEDSSLKWPREFLNYGAQVLSDESLEDFQNELPRRQTLNISESDSISF